jgi:hypothetical protein
MEQDKANANVFKYSPNEDEQQVDGVTSIVIEVSYKDITDNDKRIYIEKCK